jgi:hypothetical protein
MWSGRRLIHGFKIFMILKIWYELKGKWYYLSCNDYIWYAINVYK